MHGTNKPTPANPQLLSLEQIARHIRDRCQRMSELGADKVRLAMATGEDLIAGREQLGHGEWLPWLREACDLKERQALNYVKLAQHPTAVARYLHSCANLLREASIIGALKFISPPDDTPKRPKKVSEIETPAILGAFLDGHRSLFWQALQLAPELKGEIAQRLFPETATTTVETSKSRAEAAAQVRAIRELLRHPTSTNIETARDKATRTVRLLNPAPASKSASVMPSKAQLDCGALNKALGLNRSELDIPEFLQRAVPADQQAR
jgi:hypothetical protein